jgi:hypothetical protein
MRSAEKSISKNLAESSSPDGSERYPSVAPAKLVDGDVHDDDDVICRSLWGFAESDDVWFDGSE